MIPQGDPRVICLTCGAAHPADATSCPECESAGRKSELMAGAVLEEPQVCGICGRQDHGIKVEPAERGKHASRLAEIHTTDLGLYCGKCGAYFCWSCKLPKQSLWTGYNKAICPRCNQRVAPLAGSFVRLDLRLRADAKRESDLVANVYRKLKTSRPIEDRSVRLTLQRQLQEVGPEVVDLAFQDLEKLHAKGHSTPWLDALYSLVRIAEVGGTQILADGTVERRLLQLPYLKWLAGQGIAVMMSMDTDTGIDPLCGEYRCKVTQ